MSFVRPEIAAALARWREAAVGAGVLAFGAAWAMGAQGFMAWLALPVIALGAALVWLGRQRARFRTGGEGPGVVVLDEGRIAYFGPLSGGAMDIDAVATVALDRSGHPAHWALATRAGEALHIPVTARGAEALLDAFAGLPGFRTAAAVDALNALDTGGRGAGEVVALWRREGDGGAPRLRGD